MPNVWIHFVFGKIWINKYSYEYNSRNLLKISFIEKAVKKTVFGSHALNLSLTRKPIKRI